MPKRPNSILLWVCTLYLILLAYFPIFGQNANRTQIAVMSLETSGFNASAVIILTDRLRSELMNTGKFDVMERSRMDDLLKEQGFQQTGICNNNECIVEVGNILGVRRMVISSFGRVGKIYSISARIVDIQNGRILMSKSEDCECPIEQVLTKSIRNLAFKLAGLIPEKTVTAPINTKAKLNLIGTPIGAKVTIDSKFIGTIPIKDTIVPWGQHYLSLSFPGYEHGKYPIKIAPSEIKSYRINMIPKAKSKAILRSILFPGLGQKYAEHNNRAILYPLIEFAAIGGAVLANSMYKDGEHKYVSTRENYLRALTKDEIEQTRDSMIDKYNEAISAKNSRTLFIQVAAGTWLMNIIDSMIWGPKIKSHKKYANNSIRPQTYYCNESGLAKFELSLVF